MIPAMQSCDWVELHRGELPDSTYTVDDPQFQARLAEIDRNLEVICNPQRPGLWSLYRVVFRAGAPSGDLMRHELDLPGPPSMRWIDYIRSKALIRPLETPQDIRLAQRHWMRELKRRMAANRRRTDADWKACMGEVRSDLDIYAGRQRRSDAGTRVKPRKHPVPLRDGVFRLRMPPMKSPQPEIILP